MNTALASGINDANNDTAEVTLDVGAGYTLTVKCAMSHDAMVTAAGNSANHLFAKFGTATENHISTNSAATETDCTFDINVKVLDGITTAADGVNSVTVTLSWGADTNA